MDKYVITLGDFLKNAGIVGFRYMLEAADAKKIQTLALRKTDKDYGLIWISH